MVDELGTSMLSIRHKLVFVGNPGTGKTSLMHRLISNTFSDEYDPTIGVDFYTKTIKYQDTIFKLQLWDTAGMEKYKALIPSYIKGSSLIFLLYDITNEESFKSVPKWMNFIKETIDLKTTKVILLGNKFDLDSNRKITKVRAQNYAEENDLPFFEVSAKTSEGVNLSFYIAITYIDFFEGFDRGEKLVNELINENLEEIEIYSKNEGHIKQDSSNLNMNFGDKQIQADNNKKKKGCAC